MKVKTIICVFLLLSHLAYSQNKSYYIGSHGNDANNGLSTATAWQTLTNINSLSLKPGDKILLEGGYTFTGAIQLDQNDNGTDSNPILISSYGNGRATIYSPDTTAIHALNSGGIQLTNLILKGNSSKHNGIYFEITQTGTDLNYIYVDNIEVYNFNCRGMVIGAHSTDKGFNNISILNSSFHNNGLAGFQTFGNTGMFSHSNLHVAYCKFFDNGGTLDPTTMSGNGLVVSGVDGGSVEYCEAYNNGSSNRGPGGGPVGMWVYDTKNVVIQHCESHHNKAGLLKDGGGFDIDGGSQNCIVQYCYSHDNEGPGLLMVEYGSSIPFSNNVIRYNISQNDGRKNSSGGLGFYAVDAAHEVSNSKVYNNTIYLDANNLVDGTATAVTIQSPNFTNVQISNNIFYTTAGVDIMNSSDALSTNELYFLNNNYYSASSDYHFKWNGSDYTSLSNWKTGAAGQEVNGSVSMGIVANPLLINPGSGGTVNPVEGGSFNSLFGYTFYNSSPLIDQGIDVSNMGTTDFFGNSIPFASKYDIGASELIVSQTLPITIDLTAVTTSHHVVLKWKAFNQESIQKYELLRSDDGTHFNTLTAVYPVADGNYSYTDAGKTGNAFYRVRYVYSDGRSGLSQTLKVGTTTTKLTSAFYRTGQGLQVTLNSDRATAVSIEIYNVSGAMISNSIQPIHKGDNSFTVTEKTVWSPGNYFLRATIPGMTTTTVKFIKQ
ncbi:MAG TPA: right-handed parallel beta-helix repeat-containing protein [Flavisolibacter sp.]